MLQRKYYLAAIDQAFLVNSICTYTWTKAVQEN